MGAVDVKHTKEHELTLEWNSSASNDMIADSTLALITGIDRSPASVKCTSLCFFPRFLLKPPSQVTNQPHSHSHSEDKHHQHPHANEQEEMKRVGKIAMFLEAHFGDIELHMPEETSAEDAEQGEDEHDASLLVQLDEADATVNLATLVRHQSLPLLS